MAFGGLWHRACFVCHKCKCALPEQVCNCERLQRQRQRHRARRESVCVILLCMQRGCLLEMQLAVSVSVALGTVSMSKRRELIAGAVRRGGHPPLVHRLQRQG